MAKKKVKKLTRPIKNRVIAGVCAGVANYFNIDPTVVRSIWILLLLPGGLPGIIPYIAFWLVTPSE